MSSTLKQVMDGVKSQAGHIRGTVAQLEEERDGAIKARDAATRELEVRCHYFSTTGNGVGVPCGVSVLCSAVSPYKTRVYYSLGMP